MKVEECWSFVELGVPFRRVGWELDAMRLKKVVFSIRTIRLPF